LFALLAGGLMVVTAVFELPRVNSWRRYAGFCLGAIAFAALILVVESFGH
jgi:Na+-transporting NADH:ubiquinone oxidoreductase subunit NqrB